MKKPTNLKKGDKIGIVATARKINLMELNPAIEIFRKWSLEIVLGKHIFDEHYQFAGTDEDRYQDLQEMLDDEQIKAIIFARGGYGTIRIFDKINWTKFIKNPKWLIGFSDITTIHSYVSNYLDIETIHAIMPINFKDSTQEAIQSLKSSLFGEKISYQIKSHPLNRKGFAIAPVIGGNLSILHTLSGTNADINTKCKILVIEDLDEYLYHIDRMMMNLKRRDKLSSLAGLIVGGMTIMKDNDIPFGKNALEIVSEHIQDYDYPVCFGFPVGHLPDNRTLILGRNAKFIVDEQVNLSFD